MAGELEAPQQDELDEVAEVQARGGRVEAAVEGHRTAGQGLAQRLLVGGLREQAPPRSSSRMCTPAPSSSSGALVCRADVGRRDRPPACRAVPVAGGHGRPAASAARYADTAGLRRSQKRHGNAWRRPLARHADPRAARTAGAPVASRRDQTDARAEQVRAVSGGRARGPRRGGPAHAPGPRPAHDAAATPRTRQLEAVDHLAGPQQDRRRTSDRAGDHVRAVVEAEVPVHVQQPGGSNMTALRAVRPR